LTGLCGTRVALCGDFIVLSETITPVEPVAYHQVSAWVTIESGLTNQEADGLLYLRCVVTNE